MVSYLVATLHLYTPLFEYCKFPILNTDPRDWTFDNKSPSILTHEKFLFEICPLLIIGNEHLISKVSPGLKLFLLALISSGPMVISRLCLQVNSSEPSVQSNSPSQIKDR